MTNNSGSIDMDETVSFNVQVVPEFSGMVTMVMAFSIVVVLALSRFET